MTVAAGLGCCSPPCARPPSRHVPPPAAEIAFLCGKRVPNPAWRGRRGSARLDDYSPEGQSSTGPLVAERNRFDRFGPPPDPRLPGWRPASLGNLDPALSPPALRHSAALRALRRRCGGRLPDRL